MSYHKFTNLGEIFQGDLNNKLMDGPKISWIWIVIVLIQQQLMVNASTAVITGNLLWYIKLLAKNVAATASVMLNKN